MLAGGTDLISLMKEYLAHAQARREYQEHQGTARRHGTAAGGAHRRRRDASMNCRERRRSCQSIHRCVQAALGVASPQIRNMGTVGGDLCQRPRCWYFRQGYGLLATKDGKSLVPNGENRITRSSARRPGVFRQRFQPRSGAGRARRDK